MPKMQIHWATLIMAIVVIFLVVAGYHKLVKK